jgi:NADH-quinone oxidoreductase subunit L
VIHACAGCQDLQRLGGLRRRMPVTAVASLARVHANHAEALFSGFYSKDAVLAVALAHAGTAGGLAWGPFLLACAGSALTAVYMLRWWIAVFAGDERVPELTSHAHDPAGVAAVVLVVLVPFTLVFPWTLGGWLDEALAAPHGQDDAHGKVVWIALAMLVAALCFAELVFRRLPARGVDAGGALARRLRPLWVACSELWGIDRLWDLVFTRGLGDGLAKVTARLDLGSSARLRALESDTPGRFDLSSLDGWVDGLGRACGRLGRAGSLLHAGRLGTYLAVAAIAGAVVLLLGLLR